MVGSSIGRGEPLCSVASGAAFDLVHPGRRSVRLSWRARLGNVRRQSVNLLEPANLGLVPPGRGRPTSTCATSCPSSPVGFACSTSLRCCPRAGRPGAISRRLRRPSATDPVGSARSSEGSPSFRCGPSDGHDNQHQSRTRPYSVTTRAALASASRLSSTRGTEY